MGKIKNYFWNIIIWLDQGFNVLTGGSPDHTVSGRVGFHSARGSKIASVLEKIINTIFFFDKNHCWNSIEFDIMVRHYPYEVSELKRSKLCQRDV